METIDYNGEGAWTREAILERYARIAAAAGVPPRDLLPRQHTRGDRRWIDPVMDKVIQGIEEHDPACIQIGIEFIEEDLKFPFGKILKSNTARALRRAPLTTEQMQRIRRRVFSMLRAGIVPHEFHQYARLVKKIGFRRSDMGEVTGTSDRVSWFRSYLLVAAQRDE